MVIVRSGIYLLIFLLLFFNRVSVMFEFFSPHYNGRRRDRWCQGSQGWRNALTLRGSMM